jgi:hypothetical protein
MAGIKAMGVARDNFFEVIPQNNFCLRIFCRDFRGEFARATVFANECEWRVKKNCRERRIKNRFKSCGLHHSAGKRIAAASGSSGLYNSRN